MAMTKKEALLKAAKELFGECGYTETTFKKISERAGVLVRCSPYSDMKTTDDRELMFEKFNDIHKLLEQQLWRGIEDGSIRELLVKETAQILMSLVVGANRTRVLTPYAPPHLYREAVAFAARAITPCNACE